MELKLVYRALRKISEWTLGGFYEEVYVDGQEHVPKDGPLIVWVYCKDFGLKLASYLAM